MAIIRRRSGTSKHCALSQAAVHAPLPTLQAIPMLALGLSSRSAGVYLDNPRCPKVPTFLNAKPQTARLEVSSAEMWARVPGFVPVSCLQ